MKKILNLTLSTLFLAAATMVSMADTVFFNDTFANGSTLNSASPSAPTFDSTSYELSSSKTWVPTPAIGSGDLKFGIAASTSGGVEVQALFTNSPVSLTIVGDYVEMTIVFTNTSGILNQSGLYGFGLFNSGQNLPVAGGLNATCLNSVTDHASGNAQTWQGYVAQIAFNGGNSRIMTRTNQILGADNRVQNLTSSGSGSQSYGSPGAATVGATSASTVNLTTGSVYTDVLRISLLGVNQLAITNTLYSGPDTSGSVLSTVGATNNAATFMASGYDALALGWRATANTAATTIDISSIKVTGVSSPITTPPTITLQPVDTVVGSGGACVFQVTATDPGAITYQWHRHGTNLLDGGNISGSASPTLLVTSASAADEGSGANGYYATVSGLGGSTNSFTNSLTVVTATNLIWNSANSSTWDLQNAANFQDTNGNSPLVFVQGNPVTFDETAGSHFMTLSGQYLMAQGVTMNNTASQYTWNGTGRYAGPGNLIYIGSANFVINTFNAYSGGTLISNETAYVKLNNYSGLGVGPITAAKKGAQIEIANIANSSTALVGIPGDIVVADDFTNILDGPGTFAAVYLGNVSGTSGKTFTLNPADLTTTNRIRIYGNNTTMNADIVLNGPSTSSANYNGTTLACYGSSQTYNGVISGNGGFVSRAGVTLFNGANTFSGGTTPTTATIGFGIDSAGSITSGPIGTGPLILAPELPNVTGSGTVFASGGARTIANPVQYPSATNNQTLIIGGTNALTFTGSWALNGQDGTGTLTNRTVQVNNTNGLTTISGVMSGTGYGLIKTGIGKLALSNTETYTGPTLVSGGTLLIDGSLNAASVVTVSTNGTLGGSGTINGPVTIQGRGGVAPGNSIGKLTVNNNLTIEGGSTNTFEVNKTTGTNDNVVVTGNITYNGTLYVTNQSGTLTTADSFKLFNVSGTKTGTFTNIIGSSPGTGLAWSFTNTSGTLGVVATVNPNPTNIVASVSGSVLTLSWPADHTGWHLQVQTNSLSTGIASNWVEVPGSTLVNSTNITMDPANPAVFFRMVYP